MMHERKKGRESGWLFTPAPVRRAWVQAAIARQRRTGRTRRGWRLPVLTGAQLEPEQLQRAAWSKQAPEWQKEAKARVRATQR